MKALILRDVRELVSKEHYTIDLNSARVVKGTITDGKSEEEVIKAGEVKYYPSGAGHPHISTLRKWYKVWRTRVSRRARGASDVESKQLVG